MGVATLDSRILTLALCLSPFASQAIWLSALWFSSFWLSRGLTIWLSAFWLLAFWLSALWLSALWFSGLGTLTLAIFNHSWSTILSWQYSRSTSILFFKLFLLLHHNSPTKRKLFLKLLGHTYLFSSRLAWWVLRIIFLQ